MLISTLLLVVLTGIVSASPIQTRSPFAVKETHPIPRKWSRISPAPADHVIDLRMGLKQGQFDELERHLCEVSTPSHSRCGQHLTEAEVNDLVEPSDDTLTYTNGSKTTET